MKIIDRNGIKYARDNIKIQVTSLRETKQNKTKNHDSSSLEGGGASIYE